VRCCAVPSLQRELSGAQVALEAQVEDSASAGRAAAGELESELAAARVCCVVIFVGSPPHQLCFGHLALPWPAVACLPHWRSCHELAHTLMSRQ
jgi:hypothetical protein